MTQESFIDVAELIDRTYAKSRNGDPRPHLGASQIGKPCSRQLWYSYHWVERSNHSGRLLRLFDRGHREEQVVYDLLRSIGARIQDPQAVGSALAGRFSGSCDGIITRLHPGISIEPMVLEIKTANDKSFKYLQKHGVQKAKPEHYIQMQTYMAWHHCKKALYFVVNKNDDTIYTEIVSYDEKVYRQALDKALNIVEATSPPERVSDEPDSFQCRFCDYKQVCHKGRIPEVNCRTCVHSTMVENNSVQCAKHNAMVPYEKQLQSKKCPSHLFNPSLVPYAQVDAGDDYIQYDADGIRLINSTQGEFPSVQFRIIDPKLLNDEYVAEIQNRFSAVFIEEME